MKKYLLLGLFFISLGQLLYGQIEDFNLSGEANVKEKPLHEWGMNMTGLLNQVTPFKQATNKTGPYAVSYKRIMGNKAFRAGFGMHILFADFFNSNQDDIANMNLRLGMEFRRPIKEKFVFYHTFDLMFMGGSFNSPINDFESEDQAGLGVGLGLGIQYNLYENLSISTESIGFLGLVAGSGSIVTVTVIPPVSIFLNYKF